MYSNMISNSSNDLKDMWQILRNILPSKSISDRIPENLSITQIGNKLTSSNFGPQVDMPNLQHESANSCFVLSHIPVSFVEDYLLRLKPDNPSFDVLNIDCKLLSIAAPYISLSLTHLFNLIELMNYLITYDIISNSQFAYMKYRSTQSALHVLVDDFLGSRVVYLL